MFVEYLMVCVCVLVCPIVPCLSYLVSFIHIGQHLSGQMASLVITIIVGECHRTSMFHTWCLMWTNSTISQSTSEMFVHFVVDNERLNFNGPLNRLVTSIVPANWVPLEWKKSSQLDTVKKEETRSPLRRK